MAFIGAGNEGTIHAAGWFLKNNEECTRETMQISDDNAVTGANGGKYVPMGTIYEDGSGNPIGIVYEDVDVTDGDMPGSVVTKGEVYIDRLPAELSQEDQTALEALGFKFAETPDVTRPNFSAGNDLAVLTVVSEAGTASGDTAITVTGYTLGSGEGYVYKVDTAATPVVYGQNLGAWTAWDGDDEITAASGKIITVAVVDYFKKAVAEGHATVVAHV